MSTDHAPKPARCLSAFASLSVSDPVARADYDRKKAEKNKR